MPTNPYFSREGFAPEQNLYEDLIIEALQIYGHDFLYIPRRVVNVDTLLGEDIASQFEEAYEIEMYVETTAGYDGDELFQKFGYEIKDESTFVVSRRRWEQAVGCHEDQGRPYEGDLIYVPFSKSLFNITFVEHEKPFYQLQNLPVYKLNVTAFEYNDEKLGFAQEEGIDISNIASANSVDITINSPGLYKIGETISQAQMHGPVSGTLIKNDGTVLQVANITSESGHYATFEKDTPVVSSTTQISRMVMMVDDTNDLFEANEDIEAEADKIIEFDANNPFGEY